MAIEPVVIVGIGMVTAVGLTAAETAASVRAGVMRFAQTDFRDKWDEPFTMASVPEDGLPELANELVGGERAGRERHMTRLAALALKECLAPLTARGEATPIPLALALPETATLLPLDGPRFLAGLALQMPGCIDPHRSDATQRGRAGSLAALGQAVAAVETGAAELILAGGIDSYRDLYVLGTLDAEDRIKSSQSLDGFIPGEGAAFLLLATGRAAAARGLPVLGRISPVAVAFEPGHLYSQEPYRGDGLAGAIAQLVAQGVIEQPINEVFASMNGESHWAKEWGVSYMRNKAVFGAGHVVHHPADCIGDTGAACGPLLVGIAATGVTRGYRRPPCLILASSDQGLRAAVVLSAPTH
jgi:3-oxoacyl-[acyl-carrier-protein] synthase-1